MADEVAVGVFPDLKMIDLGDGTFAIAVSLSGMPPLTGLTAGELLVATSATTVAWGTALTAAAYTMSGTLNVTGVAYLDGGFRVKDDLLAVLGTDSDIAMLNRSTTLTADTVLAGVFVGSVDTSALAANSLIISNVTTDGDILMAISDGGSSKQVLFADGNTGVLHLGKAIGSPSSIGPGGTYFGSSVEFGGNLIIKANVQVTAAQFEFQDDKRLQFGTLSDVEMLYETADPDARILLICMNESNDPGNNVPAFVFAEFTNSFNVNLGLFDGVVQPTVVALNFAGDAYASLDSGDDSDATAKGLQFRAAADEDIELINLTNTGGTPRHYWDEAADAFRWSHKHIIDGGAVSLSMTGGVVTGGAAETDYYQNRLGGNFLSGGASNTATKNRFDGRLTGANGDIAALYGTEFTNQFTTQGAAEAIGVVAQVLISEPDITIGTATVDVAAAAHLFGAPTEATYNTTLYVSQTGEDRDFITLADTDVVTGRTGLGTTNTFGVLQKQAGARGGLRIIGIGEDHPTTGATLYFYASGGQASIAKDINQNGLVHILVEEHDGANSITNVTANGNIFTVASRAGGANVTQLILSGPVSGASPGGLWLNGGLATGGITPVGYIQHYLSSTMTSDGASVVAYGVGVTGTITGASGDTTRLIGTNLESEIVTQNVGDTIAVVAQLRVAEPVLVANDAVTLAVTILVDGMPSEGATDAGIALIGDSDIKFIGATAVLDSAAIADQVAIGGFDLGAGARALAVSQEDPVITEAVGASDRTWRVRLNGVTYKVMLHT